MKNISIALGLITLFLVGCHRNKSTTAAPEKVEGINFVASETLTAVLERAEREHKLVFLNMHTDWCMPCKMMDETVYTDKNLGKYMDGNFISYKADAEKGNGVNLASIFKIRAYPTLLFLDERGRELVRHEGSTTQTKMKKMAEKAMTAVGK